MFAVTKTTAAMLTRDGVRLDADVYTPIAPADHPAEFPVLLMRQPYGRAIASTVVYAHPSWYASHGYIVVIQDVRGRGTSEGEFRLFANEIADGEDTVNWAAQLPGSSGQVGMYGFSYQGMTQLYAAIARPAALKTICPAMVAYDLYADWAYEGGAFGLQANLGWAIQLAVETARRNGDQTAYHQLLAASRNLPLHDPIPARPDLLTSLAPDSFYHDWITHPHPDEYWANLSPKTYFEPSAPLLPMLHIGGWFDTFLRGTVNLYEAMIAQSSSWEGEKGGEPVQSPPWQGGFRGIEDLATESNPDAVQADLGASSEIYGSPLPPFSKGGSESYPAPLTKGGAETKSPQYLIIGPWAHIPWGRRTGAVDYGVAAVSECDRLQVRWFDHFLKGIDTGLLDEDPVRLFEMGSNQWRSFPTWPTATLQPTLLTTTGLTALTQNGQLSLPTATPTHSLTDPPTPPLPHSSLITHHSPTPDLLIHDPWRPVPALGGHAVAPAGSFDRASLDCRSDVLTYTSEPLAEDLHLVGAIALDLYASSEAISFDLCAVLSEVHPQGQVYPISQGYRRVDGTTQDNATYPPRPTAPIRLDLQPTCIRIPAGHALRLSISAACFPAFPVNPGTGSPPAEATLMEAQVIAIALWGGGDYPSCLWLPVDQPDSPSRSTSNNA